jgi:hypothetical protein
MVSVDVLTGVDAAVVMVSVEVPDPAVIVAGLNVPMAPLGNPAIDNAAFPVKLPIAVTVVVYVVPLPCTTDRLAGAALIVKSAGEVTTRLVDAMCVSTPEIPVIVSVEVLTGVVAAVVTVSVEVPDPPVIVAGLNVPLAPLGNPAIDNAAFPVKPFTGFTVTVYVVPLPCTTD